MAYLPISKTFIQYSDLNGDPYSGAVLKAYESGTSTVLPMATTSTGATTVTSIALNSNGYPEVSGNEVIPHINQNYNLSLYPTQAAADSNTGALRTINAIQFQELTGVTFDANNDATFAGTALFAAGEGVVFNGRAISASSRLGDYEEGSWTPILSNGTNNATSAAAGGDFIKIGSQVTASFYLFTSSLGSVSGNIRVIGLPYPARASSPTLYNASVGWATGLAIPTGSSISAYISAGNSYLSLFVWDATTGSSPMQASEWSAFGQATMTVSYTV